MSVITIRNVSDDLNARLKERARERGQSLQQFLLRELEEVADRSPIEARLRALTSGLPRRDIARADLDRAVRGAADDRR